MQKQTQYLHYNSFGMRLPGKTYTNPMQTTANKYLYNGKELQNDFGLQWCDYGARYYDAQIGRFHSIDPMIEYHYNYTGYAYVYNNPINLIDPFGLDTLPAIITPYGNIEPHKELSDINVTPYTQYIHPDGETPTGDASSSGEITEYEPTIFESARNYGFKKGIPGTETVYNLLDDISVFVTSFNLLNPTGQSLHLDGRFSIRGSKEHITSGINGFMTVMPIPIYNIRGFTIAQSNKFFKGTRYNKLTPKVKGKVLKTFNYLMKSFSTPKKVLKQTKSKFEKIYK